MSVWHSVILEPRHEPAARDDEALARVLYHGATHGLVNCPSWDDEAQYIKNTWRRRVAEVYG